MVKMMDIALWKVMSGRGMPIHGFSFLTELLGVEFCVIDPVFASARWFSISDGPLSPRKLVRAK